MKLAHDSEGSAFDESAEELKLEVGELKSQISELRNDFLEGRQLTDLKNTRTKLKTLCNNKFFREHFKKQHRLIYEKLHNTKLDVKEHRSNGSISFSLDAVPSPEMKEVTDILLPKRGERQEFALKNSGN